MTADTPALRRPPGRYDERRVLPQPARVTGYVVLGALLLGLSWVAYDRFSGGRVRATTLGYVVESDSRVVVRFEVRKDPGDTVRCRVQARDRLGSVVGSALVEVGRADGDVVRTAHPLTTTGRAATGEVLGCSPTDGATPP